MDIMDVLGPVIFVGLIGLLAVFILLKICSTRPILNTVFILAACVSLIVTSFAMPIKNKGGVAEYDWYWVLGQAVCMFLMFVLFSAEMAFDTETVEVATARETWGGGVEVTSRLEERSMFWGGAGRIARRNGSACSAKLYDIRFGNSVRYFRFMRYGICDFCRNKALARQISKIALLKNAYIDRVL